MKSTFLQSCCSKGISYVQKSVVLLSMGMLLFSSHNLVAQKGYTETHFDGQAKCGTEEMVKHAREQGLYDDAMEQYAKFAADAKNVYDARKAESTISDCPNGLIVIPISFHIFHEPGAAIGAQHNWSMAQLDAVLGSLNADFGGYNTNKDLIDECFQDVDAYNTCIQFCYGKITRIPSSTCPQFSQDYGLSNCSHDDPTQYLNIYSSNISGLGIASNIPFPGSPFGACPETYDGVYVDWDAFTIGAPANAPFDGGKTLTHEIGHWLGLFHIGGDGNCTADDMIADTPNQNGQNNGCPVGANSCNTGAGDKPDMYFNHMDYSDDVCLAMFSAGQAAIMQQVLSTGGCREEIACSAQVPGRCDPALAAASTLNNIPSATNVDNVTVMDCEGDVDLLDIQFNWYGYAAGTTSFNWVENGTDVLEIGDVDASHTNLGCGGGGDEMRTFNLEVQEWDEVNKTWGEIQMGGTVNLSIECPPTVAESDSQTDDTVSCENTPTLSATCPICPCSFDNDNMIITVELSGTHSWVSDLAFYLQGPDGITVPMGVSTCSNSGDNFNNLIFTSGAATTYDACGAAVPLTGTFTVDFNPLDGVDFSGWNLIVGDCVSQDTGSIDNFTITITDNGNGNSCLVGTPEGITYNGTGGAISDNNCTGGFSETVTFPAINTPANITWWNAATAGTQVGTGMNFDVGTDPNFNSSANGTTTYFVQCDCAPCESDRVAVDAIVQNCVPVELLAFTGEAINNTVTLDWMTASEIENSHFEIERSLDGFKFETLGKVDGAGTTVATQFYNFLDLAPKAGVNYYRLKQLDFDGTFEYSETVAIDMSKKILIAEVFPSPANEVLNVRLNRDIDKIQIYDLTGHVVAQYTLRETKLTQIDVSSLLSGTYFISIQSNTSTEILRFIKD